MAACTHNQLLRVHRFTSQVLYVGIVPQCVDLPSNSLLPESLWCPAHLTWVHAELMEVSVNLSPLVSMLRESTCTHPPCPTCGHGATRLATTRVKAHKGTARHIQVTLLPL